MHKGGTAKPYDICIIGGCGHVGLPLGLAFASRGQRVVLYDINQRAVDKVNNKVMPFLEEGAPEVLAHVIEAGQLIATTDAAVVAQSENLIVIIGTPVDGHLNPCIQDVMGVVREIIEYLQDDQLIILRSTIYPGVTQKIDTYLKEQGKRVEVAFCPERIAEGHALKEFTALPQIVSGCSETAVRRATELFLLLTEEIVELAPIEAELAKLFTNTWRYINFAISNQFYMIAESHGVDFYRVHNGMLSNYPRLRGFAKAGFAAGPCLFKDTMQLSAFSNNNFFLGHAAMLINEGLPNYVVEQLKRAYPLREKVVGILGMAFKADSDDPRESLSYKLKRILELEARQVLCSDVYITAAGFVPAEDLVERADIIVLGAPHREYKSLALNGKPVVDIWNFFGSGGRIA
jgi:UDP-N-acetyl-D-mannosaminuronic acid dehydrogenase